jgi:hypothetical protein
MPQDERTRTTTIDMEATITLESFDDICSAQNATNGIAEHIAFQQFYLDAGISVNQR